MADTRHANGDLAAIIGMARSDELTNAAVLNARTAHLSSLLRTIASVGDIDTACRVEARSLVEEIREVTKPDDTRTLTLLREVLAVLNGR